MPCIEYTPKKLGDTKIVAIEFTNRIIEDCAAQVGRWLTRWAREQETP